MTNIFKIVKIIDERSIVINAGRNQAVKEGDLFQIFSFGKEIKDPDTGESLGELDLIKAKIEVVNVFEKMALCKSCRIGTNAFSIAPMITQNVVKAFDSRPELNVLTEDVSGGYDDLELKIRVGDLVRKLGSE